MTEGIQWPESLRPLAHARSLCRDCGDMTTSEWSVSVVPAQLISGIRWLGALMFIGTVIQDTLSVVSG